MSTTGTQAIDRAAALLSLVVRADEPISFTELAGESGLARSTTSRLLSALERNLLLERDHSGAFVSGPLFALYAARHDPWAAVVRLLTPRLQRIRDVVGESVYVTVPRGSQHTVQIAQVDARTVLGARDWVGVEVPPHCSAAGKVLYAYGSLDIPDGEGVDRRLARPTERSIGTVTELRRHLSTVRRKGYATTDQELEVGLDAVAAPVLGRDGTVVAAVGVHGPSARLGGRLDDVGEVLVEHAEHMSRLLRRRTRKEGAA